MSAVPDFALPAPHRLPVLTSSSSRYALEFAATPEDLDQTFLLRYRVFNLELEEGLEASHETGRDVDRFDAHCHHLLVRDRASGAVVGTYRLQTGDMAAAGCGFYSASEFELGAMPADVLAASAEIGRACIAREHRNLRVLYLLWQGLGQYLAFNQLRYLFGCCSLTSQDPHEATRVFERLRRQDGLHRAFLIPALESHRCLLDHPEPGGDHIPRLMSAYLSLGARICSEPAIDREFRTVDYLALFDLEALEPARLAFFTCPS
ncbi:MAG: GNAT family N-acetyltransferase [Rhodothermales bacterium]|nr:GNAT family N-acetyltransferase [Rhodothermales bacterium]MBO6780499.1 GNAT family N-acetyltransferase [Rhodothermales bacterium]